ncbi:MAG TPA: ATP-binding protein [Acidimicrobiia bacterium]|nr:ATP-binding protein [Acidimicrobiia bacterium]
MPAPRSQSLASRLLITYAVAVIVVLGVLGFFVERFAREAFLSTVENGLEQQARILAETLVGFPGETDRLIESLDPGFEARVTVIGSDGSVAADSHADPGTMENHASRPEVAAALAGEVGVDRRVSVSTGFAQTYVAVPAPDGRVVRLSLPENTVTAPIGDFRLRLLRVVAVVAVVGVVAVAVVARRLAQPLGRLSEAASAVAAGDLDAEVPRSSIEELDGLGRSVYAMATELGSRLDDMEGERRTLGVVLDALPQGTLLIDSDDRILYANRSFLDMLGAVPVMLDQVVPFRIQEMVRRAREAAEVADADVEHGKPTRVLRIIVSPFEDDRALVVVSDVTERRRVDDVRRDFVTNASHELKTPVASMLASAETLQLAVERAPDRVPQFAEQIETAARSMARLIGDLLDLSRLEGRTPEYGDVELEEVARQAVERTTPFAQEHGVTIVVEADPVTVTGSASDLGLAIRNLLDNAIRYSDAGGVVTLRLQPTDGEAVVTVTDSGSGISQRDLGRVFERFYRADVGRSRETGGTGLGLSIVRHVVESHGGEVSVESELGAGSIFTMRLPRG